MPTESALSWSDALRSRRYKLLAIGTCAGLAAALISLTSFLQFNEGRTGVQLVDPVLVHLPAMDFSWALFALIYGTLFLTLAHLARQPRALLIAVQAYALLILVRIVMMYSIPLEPPSGMIMLADPAARAVGDGKNWAKDLFFSGHTSTTFLCALNVRSRPLQVLCFGASASVAVMVLLQHTHYTIDVLVAPFVAFTALRVAHHISTSVLAR